MWDDDGGEWYYYCVGCGVTFVPNLLLLFYTEHMRTHTKEKPFVCNVDGCDYAATQSSALKSGLWGCGCSCYGCWFGSVHIFVWAGTVGVGGEGGGVVWMK